MPRRTSQSWKPTVEAVEPRRPPSAAAAVALANDRSGFIPSWSSIASAENQGPQGTNLLLQPTGLMTPRQYRKSLYSATFAGPYTIGPGRFDSEALQVSIRGVGRTTNILHADVQIGVVVSNDPRVQNGGYGAINDRAQNSNSSWAFFLASPSADVDSHGRPDRFESVSTDANISGGAFVQGYSQGVFQIRYVPSGKRAPGVIEQGRAYVRFIGQIYSPNISNILRNSDINP